MFGGNLQEFQAAISELTDAIAGSARIKGQTGNYQSCHAYAACNHPNCLVLPFSFRWFA
jgi:hypothetical protein